MKAVKRGSDKAIERTTGTAPSPPDSCGDKTGNASVRRRFNALSFYRFIALGALFNLACLSIFFAEEVAQQRTQPARLGEGVVHLLYVAQEPGAAELLPPLVTPGSEELAYYETLAQNAERVIGAVSQNYGNMRGSPGGLPVPPLVLDESLATPTPIFVAGQAESLPDGGLRLPMLYRQPLAEPYGPGSGEARVAFCLHLLPTGEMVGGEKAYAWSGNIEAGNYAASGHTAHAYAPWGECDSGIQATPVPPPPPVVLTPGTGSGNKLTGWPTTGFRVSSEYGCYGVNNGVFNPSCPSYAPFWHNGIDLATAEGSPYVSVIPGGAQVLRASNAGGCTREEGDGVYWGYGLYVETTSADGRWRTLGAHLSNNSLAGAGTWVSDQQTLGYTGNTGCSTGPHLHFTVTLNGRTINPREALP